MFEISGNLHISLADISSIHGLPDHTIHITSVISSPDIVLHTPYSELSNFDIILHSYSPHPPPVIFEPDTEIFFSGQLTSGQAGRSPVITVRVGRWGIHKGRHFMLAEEFHKARVWGTGYVVGVNYNLAARRRSYLNVLDPTSKPVSSFMSRISGIYHIYITHSHVVA